MSSGQQQQATQASVTAAAEGGLWRGVARLLVHPVVGRLIAVLLIGVPAVQLVVVAARELQLQAAGQLVATITEIVLALAGIVVAALLHEGGHAVALIAIGGGAKLVFHPPIDLRTEPRHDSLLLSTADHLALRGAAGLVANALGWLVLVAAAWRGGELWVASWAFWQGVSALTATAWVVTYPATDAATMQRAVAARDRLALSTSHLPPDRLSLELQVELGSRKQPADDYWILLSGLNRLEPVDPENGPWAIDTGAAQTLLLWHAPQPGQLAFSGTGTPAKERITLLSTCGTTIELAVPAGHGTPADAPPADTIPAAPGR